MQEASKVSKVNVTSEHSFLTMKDLNGKVIFVTQTASRL